MVEVKVIQLPGGELQVLIDGDLPFEEAERITTIVLAELGAAIPGGVRQTSAVEQHREGGLRHAHIVGEVGHGR